MQNRKSSVNANNTSQDEIREKIDGFSLDNTNVYNSEEYYITTDQGVYAPPDDRYSKASKYKS